jgi:ketosteroid isomerase-like protein
MRCSATAGRTFNRSLRNTADLGDRVLAPGRNRGRGKGSGVPVDGPYGAVFDFCDGKISRIRLFVDHGEALWAAGLTE